jgi:hypothetical protein
MGNVLEDVTDQNYEDAIQAQASVIAYGIASCEPCALYDPILEKAASLFPHVRIGKAKMHVPGRCRGIKKIHNFETYPMTHFFSQGQLLFSKEGKIDEAELAALITQYFS